MIEWNDPEAPWWAKARRAHVHIAEVKRLVAEFQREHPWSVEVVAGEQPNERGFRLRVPQPVPADLITVLGDALHNMRSTLDCVAYELAVRHVGGPLSAKQEAESRFPIKKDAAEFDAFFDDHGIRRDLWGDQQRAAMRCVQPFALSDEARAMDIEPGKTPELDRLTDELYRLSQVSNIDKHRRLPILAWFPDMVSLINPPEGVVYQWRQAVPASAQFEDGTMLGYLTDPNGDAPPHVEVLHDMRLTLMDDPAFRVNLTDLLDRWHWYLVSWVLPRMFVVAEGNPPPLGFFNSDPPV